MPDCGSFEVRYGDGRPSRYFYWDDLPSRRLRPEVLTRDVALERRERLRGRLGMGLRLYRKRLARWAREFDQMPWSANDAERHTHKATTWELKELWAKIANDCLERTGDEGRAIREANAVIARQLKADR
ncbi:hypothetical protein XH88_01570 [Bradyrhizobium sp. CCBAU 51627]|nr:hypothetical protein [Bradyrhizobium sp. CCBAU 51627]